MILFFCLLHTVFLPAVSTEAQQPKKIHRIGYLSALDRARESMRSEAIWLALHDLGYVEGQNIAIDTDMRRGRIVGFLRLPPSWSVSRLISL
jgi:hypothetical protein